MDRIITVAIAASFITAGCGTYKRIATSTASLVSKPFRSSGKAKRQAPAQRRVRVAHAPRRRTVRTRRAVAPRRTVRTRRAVAPRRTVRTRRTVRRSRVDTPRRTTRTRVTQTRRTSTVRTPTRRSQRSSNTTITRKRTTVKSDYTLISDERRCGIAKGKHPTFTRHFQKKCGECVRSGKVYGYKTEVDQGCGNR